MKWYNSAFYPTKDLGLIVNTPVIDTYNVITKRIDSYHWMLMVENPDDYLVPEEVYHHKSYPASTPVPKDIHVDLIDEEFTIPPFMGADINDKQRISLELDNTCDAWFDSYVLAMKQIFVKNSELGLGRRIDLPDDIAICIMMSVVQFYYKNDFNSKRFFLTEKNMQYIDTCVFSIFWGITQICADVYNAKNSKLLSIEILKRVSHIIDDNVLFTVYTEIIHERLELFRTCFLSDGEEGLINIYESVIALDIVSDQYLSFDDGKDLISKFRNRRALRLYINQYISFFKEVIAYYRTLALPFLNWNSSASRKELFTAADLWNALGKQHEPGRRPSRDSFASEAIIISFSPHITKDFYDLLLPDDRLTQSQRDETKKFCISIIHWLGNYMRNNGNDDYISGTCYSDIDLYAFAVFMMRLFVMGKFSKDDDLVKYWANYFIALADGMLNYEYILDISYFHDVEKIDDVFYDRIYAIEKAFQRKYEYTDIFQALSQFLLNDYKIDHLIYFVDMHKFIMPESGKDYPRQFDSFRVAFLEASKDLVMPL